MDAFSIDNGFGEHKELAINLLKQVIDILNESNISNFLISGTLLGYVRHNDFIPWDDDIDLMVDSSIINKIDEISQKYENINIFYKNKYDSIKICFSDGLEIKDSNWVNFSKSKSNRYSWPFIDLFIYESGIGLHACGDKSEFIIRGEKKEMFNPFNGYCNSCFRFIKENQIVLFHNNWHKSNFFPLQKVNFLGIDCNIPNNPHYFLSRNFGKNYMSELRSSSISHKSDTKIDKIITIKL